MRVIFQRIKEQLRKRMHRPLGETARWLRQVVQGWLKAIRRRSQTGRVRWTWPRMQRLVRKHLPRPRVSHPYPNIRFRDRLKVGAV